MYVDVAAALASLAGKRTQKVGGRAAKQPDVPSAASPARAAAPAEPVKPAPPAPRPDLDAEALLEAARGADDVDAWLEVIEVDDVDALEEAFERLLPELQSLRRWDDLLAVADRALAVDGHSWHSFAHLQRSIALQNLSRLDEALASADRAVEVEQDNAHWQRACVLTLLGRKDDAVAAMREQLRVSPGTRGSMLGDSDFAPLHGHPAFEALRKA